MTRVSVASLRLTNPGISVIVVCDRSTEICLDRQSDPLVEEIDELVSVRAEGSTQGLRNRYMKTRIGSILSGPFLYLDGDTLVLGDLNEIFDDQVDIAASSNHSRAAFSDQVYAGDLDIIARMKWKIRDDVYFNAGVLFVNDTARAQRFTEAWHRAWRLSSVRLGVHFDQPAFNATIHDVEPIVGILPNTFNAQISQNPGSARDAVIWHYYSDPGRVPLTVFSGLVQSLLDGHQLDMNSLRVAIQQRHPWVCRNALDEVLVERAIRRGRFYSWETAFLRRELGLFGWELLEKRLSQIGSLVFRSH